MAYICGQYQPPNDWFSTYTPYCQDKFDCDTQYAVMGFAGCRGPGVYWVIQYDASGKPYCQATRNPQTYRNQSYAYKDETVPYQQPAYKFDDPVSCATHLCGYPVGMQSGKKRLFNRCTCFRTLMKPQTDNRQRKYRMLPQPTCFCRLVALSPAYYEDAYGIHIT